MKSTRTGKYFGIEEWLYGLLTEIIKVLFNRLHNRIQQLDGEQLCCIFWPASGCCTLQMMIEISLFVFLACFSNEFMQKLWFYLVKTWTLLLLSFYVWLFNRTLSIYLKRSSLKMSCFWMVGTTTSFENRTKSTIQDLDTSTFRIPTVHIWVYVGTRITE